jgi:hypothetical protein
VYQGWRETDHNNGWFVCRVALPLGSYFPGHPSFLTQLRHGITRRRGGYNPTNRDTFDAINLQAFAKRCTTPSAQIHAICALPHKVINQDFQIRVE